MRSTRRSNHLQVVTVLHARRQWTQSYCPPGTTNDPDNPNPRFCNYPGVGGTTHVLMMIVKKLVIMNARPYVIRNANVGGLQSIMVQGGAVTEAESIM